MWELIPVITAFMLNGAITYQIYKSYRYKDTRSIRLLYAFLVASGLSLWTAYFIHHGLFAAAFNTAWGAMAWTIILFMKLRYDVWVKAPSSNTKLA